MHDVLIVGAGPAGLMAADRLSSSGLKVAVVDRMPSPARKFLMAGRGGLNLTHSEKQSVFLTRYREAEPFLAPLINKFTPENLRQWCLDLGQETFTGSSGRIFPKAMKASPLLRALLSRLAERGVTLQTRLTWSGFSEEDTLTFKDPDGREVKLKARASLLALGGASWPRLGSDGNWVSTLHHQGVEVNALRPANCGFEIAWSDLLKERFAGSPLKPLTVTLGTESARGEAILSQRGLEGGAVYALSSSIRREIELSGKATLLLDLRPDISIEELTSRLSANRGKQSVSTFLRKAGGLSPVQISLLREVGPLPETPQALAERIKQTPLTATAPYPIDRAISSAGGIALTEIDDQLMLKKLPGVFVAGEMLDWEAPTGGYLLQACFATGVAAAEGIANYLNETNDREQPS
ncbi:TIGR03862 family flavoprotein [uncultured Roseibium sp.]|uniref:TIGR03862 family flavoprotein n=1 Tax=uncultured Roseibium sp. TaxID=1936171 RepID=UPI00259467C9|nr:TIGR03862 family flavoprotein [uncultured Roseibium sp.]